MVFEDIIKFLIIFRIFLRPSKYLYNISSISYIHELTVKCNTIILPCSLVATVRKILHSCFSFILPQPPLKLMLINGHETEWCKIVAHSASPSILEWFTNKTLQFPRFYQSYTPKDDFYRKLPHFWVKLNLYEAWTPPEVAVQWSSFKFFPNFAEKLANNLKPLQFFNKLLGFC